MIGMLHFFDFREFIDVAGREAGKIRAAGKGDHIFLFFLFHDDIPCRHHADRALQLAGSNHDNAFFLDHGRAACFDPDGVIIGLQLDFSVFCSNEVSVIGIGCNFCLCSPLYAVDRIRQFRFVENDSHGSTSKK